MNKLNFEHRGFRYQRETLLGRFGHITEMVNQAEQEWNK